MTVKTGFDVLNAVYDGGTKLNVDGSGATQPVSGTVTATVPSMTATGTGAALNAVLFSIDASGYQAAYVTFTLVSGSAGSVSIAFQASNDNVNWDLATYLQGFSPPYSITGEFVVVGGENLMPIQRKVRVQGKYLRCILTAYNSSDTTIRATAYFSAADNREPVQPVTAQLTDSNGNFISLGQAEAISSLPVVLASDQRVVAPFYTRSDTYTSTGNGTIIDCSLTPVKRFALQVTKTGTVTSWDVRLEGSLDGVTFTQILQHTNVTPGDGLTQFSLTNANPVLYFRSRAAAFVIGSGTNVVTTILGLA